MHDPDPVQGRDARAELTQQLEGPPPGERALADEQLLEGLTGDELHGVVAAPLDLARVVDHDHVRVADRREVLDLPLEAPLGARLEPVEDLDRALDPQLEVARAVDLAHAPLPDRLEELVGP